MIPSPTTREGLTFDQLQRLLQWERQGFEGVLAPGWNDRLAVPEPLRLPALGGARRTGPAQGLA